MTNLHAAPRGRIFQPLGAILSGINSRAPSPLRGQSRLAGTCEHEIWKPCRRNDVQQILLAARRYEVRGRQRGKRNGPLGTVALEVLDLMVNLIRFKTGQLDPSLNYLMQKLRRSKDAIVRALNALRDHGFINWLRRFVPTEREGRGPQIRQTSNAYCLVLPPVAARLLNRWIGRPAMPDDILAAEDDRKAGYQAQLRDVTCAEYLGFVAGVAAHVSPSHRPNTGTLAEFARCMEILAKNQDRKRESAERTEYQSHQ